MSSKTAPSVRPVGPHALGREALNLVAARFRALAEPVRLEILQVLRGGEHTVSELARAVGTTSPNVSKHLRLLEEAGFVRRRPQGTAVLCAVRDGSVYRLCDVVCESLREQLSDAAELLAPPVHRG